MSQLNSPALWGGVDACTRNRHEQLKDRVRFLARKLARSVMLRSQLEALGRQLESALPALDEVARRLQELSDLSPKLRSAMEEYEHQASVGRAESFLGDLAEDRSSAPPEIVPLIDHYFARLREVISTSWDRQISRRELDAHVLQVRLSYSQDLDRILQGLVPR
jgi:hypothetical protein